MANYSGKNLLARYMCRYMCGPCPAHFPFAASPAF